MSVYVNWKKYLFNPIIGTVNKGKRLGFESIFYCFFFQIDHSWFALRTKSMKNSEIITKAQGKSIVHCWDQARNRKSPFFMWNPSENGTCHLSKTLSNSTLVNDIYSFAQCEEFATNENSLFFWDANGEGSCYLITEDSQICTSPAGSKCSKGQEISEGNCDAFNFQK